VNVVLVTICPRFHVVAEVLLNTFGHEPVVEPVPEKVNEPTLLGQVAEAFSC